MAIFQAIVASATLALASAFCQDANESYDPDCFGHIQWAMAQGHWDHPDWYPNGTSFESVVDVQCALFLKMGGLHDGNSHNCSHRPCEAISTGMAEGGDPEISYCFPRTVESTEGGGPSIEWWGWVLIVLAVLLVGALAAFALGLFGTKKPKKKRAIKVEPTPEPPVETVVAPMTSYVEVAPPIYTYMQQPTYQQSVVEPMYVSSIAQPLSLAQPVSMAQPVLMEYTGPVYHQDAVATTVMPLMS